MILNTKKLKEVEIGIPVIADAIYFALVSNAEIKENKLRTGNNLVLKLKVLNPIVQSHDGRDITNRGQVVLTRYISLVETEDYDPNKNLKELAIAVGVPEGEDLNLEDLQGKKLKLKVAYRPADGQYGESNDVKRFLPIKPEDNVPDA